MLNPIDAGRVIRHRQVSGRFPTDLHQGVAWWVAACFVVATKATRMAVAHDDHRVTAEFHHRFLQGAVNAQHWACHVSDLGTATDRQLLDAMDHLGGIPGAHLATKPTENNLIVTIRLYAADGRALDEDTGLARIRDMISHDRVPIPVNTDAKGKVTDHSSLVTTRGGAA
ncbi:hypothetical protein [Streptomyces sp. TRM64462]|uniref:hypothetical protein n=1 Tax=Streptomyces sp. TRM64462 TaxID=2741726 RepID=UPI0015860277|nr:hypothetical protein [Streptomyces sp. TRM64462]